MSPPIGGIVIHENVIGVFRASGKLFMDSSYDLIAFVQRVDNSIGAWSFPKEQMAKFLAFWNDCTALWKSF